MKELGIYIHIPFCQKKCYYCDFKSFSNKFDIVEQYINYLIKEIDLYSDKLSEYKVDTIFIGGGTPSCIDAKKIYMILNHIYNKVKNGDVEEITIETNPKTLDENKLNVYKDIGINRISIGAQTINDKLLKRIGRIHSSKDFYKSYELIRKKGFKNVNVDIMFNLPGQTIDDVLNTLYEIINLEVKHLSFYSLKVEEGTPFHNEYMASRLNLPHEDVEREMYHKGIEVLKSNKYVHYEISNFAKEEYECKHNIKYWDVKPYIGLGLAAHSNIDHKRYYNYNDFNNYFNALDNNSLPIEDIEKIDIEMEMAEVVILGLRLIKGINKKSFYDRFKVRIEDVYRNKLIKLEKQGLLSIEDKYIKLTKLGLDLSNIVFQELLP